MIDTHAKTKSVTNTQIAVAVGIAFLAGGLAFAASPQVSEENACSVQTVTFGSSCGSNKARGASYVCSDGSTGQVVGNNCRTLAKLQQIVERTCGRLQCIAAPVHEETPVVPEVTPPQTESEATPAAPIPTPVSAGEENSLVKPVDNVPVGFNINRVNSIPQDPNDTPSTRSITRSTQSAKIALTGEALRFKNDTGFMVGVKIVNIGTDVAPAGTRYNLFFLGEDKTIMSTIDLNLSSDLKVGEEGLFESSVSVPGGARFAQVVIDPMLPDITGNSVVTPLPSNL